MKNEGEKTAEVNSLKEQIKKLNEENINIRQELESQTTEYESVSMDMALALAEDFDALNRASNGDFSARAYEDSKNELLAKLGQMINKMIDTNKEMLDGTLDQVKLTNEKLHASQKTILDMSTPVIQVWKGILVLPLIGVVDSHRAHQARETLLNRIVEEEAKMVIIDITGVPVVDSVVAKYLAQTCAAIKLIGAEGILTGISVNVAQILVRLGIDFTGIITKSNLAEGLEVSLKKTGLAVFPLKKQ
ncbi:MAG: STAS domain-containing protein [bacterium]